MHVKTVTQIAFMMLLVLNVFGCAAGVKEKVVFPPPPGEARYEWIGTYGSEADFGSGFISAMAGEAVVGGEGFVAVMGITGAKDGTILLCDTNTGKVKILDLEQKFIKNFTDYPLGNPVSIDTDQQGQVYVSDPTLHQVLVFNSTGTLLRKIGDEKLFSRPSFLLVNDDLDRLYVSDPEANNVKVFSLNGELLFTFGKRGKGDGEMHVPQGMAFDSAGQLFLADSLNARVQVFTADGEFLRKFGERGPFDHQMEAPKDLAFDSEGHLYMTDSRKPKFKVVDPESNDFLLSIGSEEISAHKLGFNLPSGIYIDSSDRVYVGDFMIGRVTVWQYLSEAYRQRAQQDGKAQ